MNKHIRNSDLRRRQERRSSQRGRVLPPPPPKHKSVQLLALFPRLDDPISNGLNVLIESRSNPRVGGQYPPVVGYLWRSSHVMCWFPWFVNASCYSSMKKIRHLVELHVNICQTWDLNRHQSLPTPLVYGQGTHATHHA